MGRKKGVQTFIVHHRGRASHGGFTVIGRYRVGAKNEKNAEELLREEIGKHNKVSTYYADGKNDLKYGEVVREC
ncbi:hypothetical protein CN495_08890 [Bacillus thuringiensis]|uniref:Uncharacterized protein n=1 Tax=Bacillus thuringiensis TaxID=1428 RepID=A0ABD6SD58_BACTU|nr:hypothetical protein [Bacillus thuringiensis]PER55857.1 hypothetical protein CN495_08890 [Bacillus thuringiensis]